MLARSVLVTGSSRGIGLELVRQLVTQADIVIATCRDPDSARELQKIAQEHSNVHIIALDVIRHDTYEAVAAQVSSIVGADGLTLLINNAGLFPPETCGDLICTERMAETYLVNTISPLVLTKTLLPLLQAAAAAAPSEKYSLNMPVVILMSSDSGSIASQNESDYAAFNAIGMRFIPAYCCSKAAMNMSAKILSIDLKKVGITVISLHPGWVKTDGGSQNAEMTVEESIGYMIETMHKFTAEQSGAFLNFDGKPLPW